MGLIQTFWLPNPTVFSPTREFFGSDLSAKRKAEFCAKTVWHKKKNLHIFPLRGAKENKGLT